VAISLSLSLSVTLLSLGCGSDATAPAGVEQDGYWALELNHHAITLSLAASNNQLKLAAVPLTINDDTLYTQNKVRYTSNDSSVIVDSTGLLTARLTRLGVKVIASLTVANDRGQAVTLADTAVVNVNDPPAPVPVATTLQITTPGDSATFSPVPGMVGFTVTVLDASHHPLTDDNPYNVFCRSSNRNVSDFGRGKINYFQPGSSANLPGTTTIVCRATIYGVSLTDSLPIRIGPPLLTKITVDTQLVASGPPNVVVSTAVVQIGVGGIIEWDNNSAQTVDLVFDDSTALQSVPASERVIGSGILGITCYAARNCNLPSPAGNVVLLPSLSRTFKNGVGRDFRKFPVAGTYPYHSATFPNVAGTIIVSSEWGQTRE
jgi:hypothetical protein